MNEKFAESMIDSLVDTAGRLVTGVISGGDDVDPGDGGVGDDTDDDDPGDDPGDDAITTGNAKGKVGVSMPSKDLQRWNQDGERLQILRTPDAMWIFSMLPMIQLHRFSRSRT